MRLVIDLRLRAFGGFVLSLATALGKESESHEVWVSVNASDPSLAKIRAALAKKHRLHLHEYRAGHPNPADTWITRSSAIVADFSQSELIPDAVLRLFSPGDVLPDREAPSPLQVMFLTRITGLKDGDAHQLRKADLILLASPVQFSKARLLFPELAEKMVEIPCGHDEPDEPATPLDRIRFGIAGRFLLTSVRPGTASALDRLMAIYATLPNHLREMYQLVVLDCSASTSSHAFWQRTWPQIGIEPGSVVWLRDIDLVQERSLVHECDFYVPLMPKNDVLDPISTQLFAGKKRFDGLAESEDDCAILDLLISALSGAKESEAVAEDNAVPWSTCSKHLWIVLENALTRHREAKSAAPVRRPRLALVSPFPPERTGIADYAAELAPELGEYYDVELVIKQPELSSALAAQFPVRDWAWFDKHADHYDRVIYQLGNSRFHWHMWDLLERHPGVVVLHDFFVGNALAEWEMSGQKPNLLARSLYESHGYKPLINRKAQPNPYDIILSYPGNFPLLEMADGVIVHSQLSLDLADEWYGAATSANWVKIPLLRKPIPGTNPTEARKKLGIAETDFVVCSFGGLSTYKMNQELAEAWNQSELAKDKNCHLYFVGDNGGGFTCAGERIRITGYADQEMYRSYLAAADLAVQLRTKSRGETSAAVLDCLLQGVPTIVNANGSMAELPDDVVRKLPDGFEIAELTNALNELRADPVLRKQIALHAEEYMTREHAPKLVGKKYFEATELFHKKSWQSRKLAAETTLIQEGRSSLHTKAQYTEAEHALKTSSRRMRQKQMFLDVTAVAENDIKTGIQRVVRAIALELMANPPAGYRIEPIILDRSGITYAREFTCQLLGIEPFAEDTELQVFPGDMFVGLDLNQYVTERIHSLQRIREQGAAIYFCVFDILPVLRKDCFPEEVGEWFRTWLQTVASVADGLFCISKAVASETHQWLEINRPQRTTDLSIGYFHLGANFQQSAPTQGGEEAVLEVEKFVAGRQLFLMVSTLEPRKGYAQALAAFEYLWALGNECVLVIIGKPGWKKGGVIDDLRSHPERGRRLLWLESASDQVLEKVYQMASALVFASEGEGFGLPLIEAARYGVPIIARDIPVFRELAKENAFYFNGLKSIELARAISTWQKLKETGEVADSRNIQYIDWAESARQVCKVLLGKEWFKTWEV